MVCPHAEAFSTVLWIGMAGQDDYAGGGFKFLEFPQDIKAVLAGHADIKYDNVRFQFPDRIHSYDSIARLPDNRYPRLFL